MEEPRDFTREAHAHKVAAQRTVVVKGLGKHVPTSTVCVHLERGGSVDFLPRSPAVSPSPSPFSLLPDPPGRTDLSGMEHARRGKTYQDSAGAVHIPARFAAPSFSPNRCAAARVVPGAEVVFHTADDGYERLSLLPARSAAKLPQAMEEMNEVTGPLHIEGALPGDALRVEVLDVTVQRCWSVWTADEVISGCLASKLAALGHPSRVRQLEIDQASNTVQISERLRVPLEPMIGCIATAPEPHDDCQWNCGCSTMEPTFKHGGNMDLRELGKGAAIVLPVQNEGGLLFLGDLHACMVRKKLGMVVLASKKTTREIDMTAPHLHIH